MPLQIVRNDITKMSVDAIVNLQIPPCSVAVEWMAAFTVQRGQSF